MQVSFQNFDIYCKSRQCKWAKCWNCNSCKFSVYIFIKRWKFKLSNINKGTQSPKIEQCKKVAKRRLVYSFKQFKLTQNSFMAVIYFNLARTRNVLQQLEWLGIKQTVAAYFGQMCQTHQSCPTQLRRKTGKGWRNIFWTIKGLQLSICANTNHSLLCTGRCISASNPCPTIYTSALDW